MGFHENAIPPRIGITTDGLCGVVLPEISQDLRVRGIGGANGGPSVEQPVALIEIDGLRHVRRNHRIVFAGFFHAIYLDG